MTADTLGFLVVDDDALLRMTTKNMLRSMNAHTVLEAANGVAALDTLRIQADETIDIVLCDLNMPGMDGMEFLRHLGEDSSRVSVIVVSSHDDALISSVKKMAVAYGVKLLGTAQKPISRDHLEGFIARYKPTPSKPDIRPSTLPKFSLDEIILGIERKEFEPFYQPKVSFSTGRIKGAEALARWIHPTQGVIAPYAFIETLEKSGNIDGLTFQILEKAVMTCKLLHDKGQPLSISVNLSLNSLGDPALADNIIKTVHDAGVDPGSIMLEVTESATMTDIAHSLENLARLRMRGFGLSVDDYGTGSSNIQQLTRVAFSELKIDQSFVRGCADNKNLCVITKSSIEMAHQLKMECIAEGVETRQDWEMLKSMSCDTAQGYFIAKPMNLPSFIEFCSTHSSHTLLGA